MGWTVHVVRKKSSAYRVLVNQPEGVRPLPRSKSRWKHIKIYRKKLFGRAWIWLSWFRKMNK